MSGRRIEGCSCLCHEQDPVSKLEAMGYRCEMDIDRETNLPVLDVYPVGTTGGPHFSEILVAGLSCHEQITDAATRLLARILEAYDE